MYARFLSVLAAIIGLCLGIALFIRYLGPSEVSGLTGFLRQPANGCVIPDIPPPLVLGLTLYGWFILGMAILLFLRVTSAIFHLQDRSGLAAIQILIPVFLLIFSGLEFLIRDRIGMDVCPPDWLMRMTAVLLTGFGWWLAHPIGRTFAITWREAWQWITPGQPVHRPTSASGLVLVAAMFLGLAVVQRQAIAVMQWTGTGSRMPPARTILSDHLGQPEVNFDLSGEEATLGPAEARVKMVVFSDFECPYCAELSKAIQRWHRAYPDRLQIVYKNFPLSPACNSLVRDDLHPLACQAALACAAAGRQDGFWTYHDSLFSGSIGNIDLIGIAIAQGLDPVRFVSDMQDPGLQEKIRQDIRDAGLGLVTETPTVFVNGRKASTANPVYLDQLLESLMPSGVPGQE